MNEYFGKCFWMFRKKISLVNSYESSTDDSQKYQKSYFGFLMQQQNVKISFSADISVVF